jgi:lipoate-protein ligase A
MTSSTLLVLRSGHGEPRFNMALDEALLESAVKLGSPVLRFYGWAEPAASFGYFQHYSAIERDTLLRPLVRRPTGGGIVPHDRDWTYSAIFPPTHAWYGFSAVESYRQIHQWIQRAFLLLDVPTELAAEARKAGGGQCFVGHEKSDLLRCGQKIAGAAQRRTKRGLLIQGSVQPAPLRLDREMWETTMLKSLPVEVAVRWEDLDLDGCVSQRAQELAQTKYSRTSYNRKR